MGPDEVVIKLEEAGFLVEIDYESIFVGLQNRAVTTAEVALVLDCEPNLLKRHGKWVEIDFSEVDIPDSTTEPL